MIEKNNHRSSLITVGRLEEGRPTVLLLPGSITSPSVFSRVESDGVFQLAVVDYCRSTPPWDVMSLGKRIVELILDLRLGKTLLAGYSAGGVIAMAAASHAPATIAGMLLSNTGPCGKGHGNPDFPAQLKASWGDEAFLKGFFSSCFSKPVPPILMEELMSYAASVPLEATLEVSLSLREVDLRSPLEKYSSPVIVAHGMKDTRRGMEHVKMLLHCMPHARFIPLHGGHTVMVEDREGWQKALNELMAEVGSPSGQSSPKVERTISINS